MKVTVLQENLNKTLTTAARIVSGRPQMPILSHVLLRAETGGLTVAATNLEIGLKEKLGAKVDVEGDITVPVKTFLELMGNLGPGPVDLSVEGSELKVKGSGVQATVNGVGSAEFPELPPFNEQSLVALPAQGLKKSIEDVVFAAATDDTRPVLTGVLIKLQEGTLEMVGTDGFRLSLIKGPIPYSSTPSEWLVPAKTLQELLRLIGDDQDILHLSTVESGNQLVLRVGDSELSTRLVSGKFPDYKKILPDGGDIVAELDKDELLRAMRLAAVFARESANIVRLEVRENGLFVRANAPQVGDNEVVVDAKVEGGTGRIAFNYRYVLDYLNVCETKTVQFQMSGPLAAGLWKEVDGKKKELLVFTHVIMPVRLEE